MAGQHIIQNEPDWKTCDSYGNTVLHLAVESGNCDAIQHFISMGAKINTTNKHGKMPIHRLSLTRKNFPGMLNLLLQYGAEINAKSKSGNTPILYAAYQGRSPVELKQMVRNGADWQICNKNGNTVLHLAVEGGNWKAIKYFVSNGANINITNKYGEMPIHFMGLTEKNFDKILSVLLLHGTDINAKSKSGNTPILCATYHGSSETELKQMVENGADWKICNMDGKSVLHLSVEYGNLKAFKYFVSIGANINIINKYGDTPVHFLSLTRKCFNETLSMLLENGADINAKSESGTTPLLYAAFQGRSELELKQMVEVGADWKICNNYGNTVLHLATEAGNYKAFQYFASLGANTNATNNNGETPIHFLRWTRTNFKEMLNLLLKHGADINAKSKSGNTVLLNAVFQRKSVNVLKQLVDNGADWKASSSNGKSVVRLAIEGGNIEALKYFVSIGADIHQRNNEGEMPAHFICLAKENFIEMFSLLREHGAEINAKSNCGNTPILKAALLGRSESELKQMVEIGADWKICNNLGNTVLHLAVEGGSLEALKYFISIGMNINITNNNGEMPVHMISLTKNKFNEMLTLLLQFGADINAKCLCGNTPLLNSVFEGRSDAQLKQMVDNGANWNICNNNGNTVLHLAAEGGNCKALKYFGSIGAKINIINKYRETPFHFLSLTRKNFEEMLCLLLCHGADINAKSKSGNTPILEATFKGKLEMELKQMVEKGADWKMRNKNGKSVLHLAVEGGNWEAFKYFVSIGANVNITNKSAKMPVHFLSLTKNYFTDMLNLLLEYGVDINAKSECGNTPILEAALHGRSNMELDQMVRYGADWKICNNYGNTVLHLAVEGGNYEGFIYFLSMGANVNVANIYGEMPVHFLGLTNQNFDKMLVLLREYGADINAQSECGNTPLLSAACQGRSETELKQMVQNGADWKICDNHGNTILHLAVMGGNCQAFKYFVSVGANADAANYAGDLPLHFLSLTAKNFDELLSLLLENGADINAKTKSGNTPLLNATLHGKSEIELRQMVENGADWKIRNNRGNSILHLAVEGGNCEAFKYFISLGANVNATNNEGEMPMHALSSTVKKFKEMVKLLDENGADINAISRPGSKGEFYLQQQKFKGMQKLGKWWEAGKWQALKRFDSGL